MSPKYIKPVSRDLGTVLSEAQGVCRIGSLAGPDTSPHCEPGGTASGGTCVQGDVVTGCILGYIPDIDECSLGGGF